jgi:hypothetical protein
VKGVNWTIAAGIEMDMYVEAKELEFCTQELKWTHIVLSFLVNQSTSMVALVENGSASYISSRVSCFKNVNSKIQ